MTSPQITYTSSHEVTAEAELAALVATYKFVLFSSQASKGGPQDLTNKTTTEHVENGPRTTEKEKT